MRGKTVLITGATDGIGKVALLEIAKQGAAVIGVGRNPDKIKRVQREAALDDVADRISFLEADLSDMGQVRDLAAEFLAEHDRLDVLVNNAGALFKSRKQTADGFEMTFALNHLAYFLLTVLLLDTLKASAPARIVNVASQYQHDVDFDDLQNQRVYSGWTAYGRSKMANILFTFELARRLEGTGVTANCLHPGTVRTNFQEAAGTGPLGGISPEQGADTLIYLATSEDVEGVSGEYYVQRRTARAGGQAYNVEAQRRLWEVSAGLVGVEA